LFNDQPYIFLKVLLSLKIFVDMLSS